MLKKIISFIRKIFLVIINFIKSIFIFFKNLFTGKYKIGKKIKVFIFSIIGIFSKNTININDKNYKEKVKKDDIKLDKLIEDVAILEKTVTTRMFGDPEFEYSKKQLSQKEKEFKRIKDKYIDVTSTESSSIKSIKEKIEDVEVKVKKTNKTIEDRDEMIFDYKSESKEEALPTSKKRSVKDLFQTISIPIIKKDSAKDLIKKGEDINSTIKKMNIEIVSLKENLTSISKKVMKASSVDVIDSYEYQLYWVKDRIITLKKDITSLIKKEEKESENIEVINKLFSASSLVDDLLDNWKNLNDKIKCVDELKETEKEQVVKEEKKKKSDYKLSVGDIHLIDSSIKENLSNTHKEIDKLKKIVDYTNPKIRKRTFYGGILDFLKNTLEITVSMFPIVLFKNQLVGYLTSTILINNKIRTLRKVICSKNKSMAYIEYRDIIKKLETKQGCLENTKIVLSDTLSQIEKLEYEIEQEYKDDFDTYPQIIDIYRQLDNIRNQIVPKKEEIELMVTDIEKVKKKIL